MKLKTFLLGSAAAMMAFSTAQAADAVVAEPEPVEYVRVCDTYGAGYFFIPGTETCIKFSGEVRVEYDYATDKAGTSVTNVSAAAGSFGAAPTAFPNGAQVLANGIATGQFPAGSTITQTGFDTLGQPTFAVSSAVVGSEGDWGYRARLNIQTATETDFGTLSTFIRLQGADNDPVDATVGVDRAIISLGGLTFGYSDYFWARNQGYGILGAINDAYYGYNQAIFVEYTYAANGFSLTGGLEQVDSGTRAAENPNFYAGAVYGGSWGQVSVQGAYDNPADDYALNAAVNLLPLEGLRIEAFYSFFDDGTSVYARSSNATDYAWGVGASYTFGSVTPYILYTDTDVAAADYLAAGAIWTPVAGLNVQAEARFNDLGDDSAVDLGEVYHLRVVRSF